MSHNELHDEVLGELQPQHAGMSLKIIDTIPYTNGQIFLVLATGNGSERHLYVRLDEQGVREDGSLPDFIRNIVNTVSPKVGLLANLQRLFQIVPFAQMSAFAVAILLTLTTTILYATNRHADQLQNCLTITLSFLFGTGVHAYQRARPKRAE